MGMASHAQNTQNNKFAKSFQYLKKEVRDEVIFCADKHQSSLEVGTTVFDERGKACLNYSK